MKKPTKKIQLFILLIAIFILIIVSLSFYRVRGNENKVTFIRKSDIGNSVFANKPIKSTGSITFIEKLDSDIGDFKNS